MGILQRAVTLILRCESKFRPVKPITLTHSACPCKNYVPKCSQIPHELDYKSFFVFFYLVVNYLVFNLPATRVSFDGMPVRETYIQIDMALLESTVVKGLSCTKKSNVHILDCTEFEGHRRRLD